MNRLTELFGFNTNQEHPLVIAQYERADFTVGNEEEFHWAIIVLTNGRDQKGPCWQALEYSYSDGRGLMWKLVAVEVGLTQTEKCFGGVRIGSIKPEDLTIMDEVSGLPLDRQASPQVLNGEQIVQSNTPIPKFDGWTCRDWVMESLELIRPHGWVDPKVTTQSLLIPFMRMASQATRTRRETKKNREIVIVGLEEGNKYRGYHPFAGGR